MADLLSFILIFYTVLLLGMYLFQRRLMYFPDTRMGTPDSYNLNCEVENIITEDGVTLTLWHHPAREGWPTMLYFHGNRGHLGDRANKFRHFMEAGLGLICVSYRGFGPSSGAPSERGLYHDARALWRYAVQTRGIPPQEILLYGESLGTGVAVHLARECAAGALVLEAPYTSVAQRAGQRYPYLPARWMTRDRYDSIAKIPGLEMPLLLLHGEEDETIPVAHGRAVLAAAPEPKRGIFYPGIHHADFDLPQLTADVVTFARDYGLIRGQ